MTCPGTDTRADCTFLNWPLRILTTYICKIFLSFCFPPIYHSSPLNIYSLFRTPSLTSHLLTQQVAPLIILSCSAQHNHQVTQHSRLTSIQWHVPETGMKTDDCSGMRDWPRASPLLSLVSLEYGPSQFGIQTKVIWSNQHGTQTKLAWNRDQVGMEYRPKYRPFIQTLCT